MSATPIPAEELHRLSVDDYHRLVDSGGLEDARVELIDGLVVDMSPKNPEHEYVVVWLMRWLTAKLDFSACDLLMSGSLTLGSSELQPDLAVVRRWTTPSAHPSSALLVIEVARSSRVRDLETKPAVYAPYVAEYWVVELDHRRVVVHRDPAGDGYASLTVVDDGTMVAPRAIAIGDLDTAALFAAALGA